MQMVTLNEIAAIIESYSYGPDYRGPVDPNEVAQAEETLGVTFPHSYRQFLERYGCGNLGYEIYGLTPSNTGVPSAVWKTRKEREAGYIPDRMVIVCDEGEYVLCLDTSTMNDEGECKVVSWILGLPFDAQPYSITFDTFLDFLQDCVRYAIDGGWWKK